MPGRAPLQRWVLRPHRRRQRGGIDFRDLVLQELDRVHVAEFRILRERRPRVAARAVAVQQEEPKVRARSPPTVQNLPDGQVEKSEPVVNGKQRLRPLQAHPGAESAVEIQHRSLAQQRRIRGDARGDLRQRGQVASGLDRRLRDQPGFVLREESVTAFEGTNRRLADAGSFHLFPKCAVHHAAHHARSARGCQPAGADKTPQTADGTED